MKKKITAIVLVVVVLAMLFTGMTLAYFTDEKEAENVFVFGDIDIELDEGEWNPDDPEDPDDDPNIMEDVFPGMEFDKEPTITNTGDADAYIRMGIEMNPAVLLDLVNKAAPAIEAMLHEILMNLAPANSGWVFDEKETTDEGNVIFWYNGGILTAGGRSAPLFTDVKIPADYTGEDVEAIMGEGRIFGINVIAQAIQTVGFNSADEAYAALEQEYQH